MKKTHFYITLTALAAILFVMPGCKKFLDVNDNPNQSETANVELILPSTQAAIAQALGLQYTINAGFWMQYWTQDPYASQYKSIDSYNMEPANFDRPWAALYATALTDLQTLTNYQTLAKYAQYSGVAYLLKAYSFQLLTDAFGDVPLADALKGNGNLSPTYAPQQVVYDSIFLWIRKGLTLIDPNTVYPIAVADGGPGGDLIYNGNLEAWESFGYTLWLRAALKIRNANEAKTRTEIAALMAMNPTWMDENAELHFQNVGGNRSPIYAETVALNVVNIRSSKTAIDNLKKNADGRLPAFYVRASGTGIFNGLPQGDFNASPTRGTYSSVSQNAIGPLAPVKYASVAETYFLRSEARLRGYISTGPSAQTLFTDGIKASFISTGVTAADSLANAYITLAPDAQWSATVDTAVKRIIVQKYYAFSGSQTFEAWCDWRRTGYPDFLVRSVNSALPGNTKPLRFIYPSAELTRNANFPGLKTIAEPVWWDR
ncbi:SusD-like starch-binding protein associating with outer membrane [Chitinophaga skermanii]|uniref:SusD-like starch-binding protein associating with outer membrane n=1 Tax=Chitinophaga skermanii TaxID=331697 RepID=A0A327QQ73_9BACT|nr:SusD/RagB family nutrient-binding outer membrane lipoprotein [Chitinophaga skermanii]RAJ03927.1 SusD-like starch-binding protein associating with outer membrane [Chitinophaga skermanii]